MIVSDNIFIKYYDKETGYGILIGGKINTMRLRHLIIVCT